MKHVPLVFMLGFLLTHAGAEENYKLTNKDGKTIEVELIAVEGEKLVVKTAKKTTASIPIDTLSDKDQEYIKTWWEKNAGKPRNLDVRVSVEKESERVDRETTRTPVGDDYDGDTTPDIVNKQITDEFHFTGKMENYSRKDFGEIDVDYVVYKRVSTDDGDESDTEVEKIRGSDKIASLPAKATGKFETEKIRCLDMTETGGNESRKLTRETVIGVVFIFSTSDGEFLRYGYPDGFLERADKIE